MGRRKIEIKAIKDDRNRSVTFLKRKGGLFKKAHELSVLCSVDVAVFIFGNNKKLYEYSSGDMRELITRYTYHIGPNEHKGPSDFNGGADDDEDDDGEGTPPHGHEGSVEPQMMPHFQGQHQPPFPHLRGHTPSASPPINGVPFVPRGHTPQPQMGSRPSSRNDFRRVPNMPPQTVGPPAPNGYAFMPHPAIYNPQNQPNMPPNMQHSGQYPYPPPQHQAPPQHAQMQQYMEEQRRASVPPPNFPPQGGPPAQQVQRQQQSPPQPHPQQLPPQSVPVPHMSPPQPQPQPRHVSVSPPQPQHQQPPQQPPQEQQQPQQKPQPPAPMEPKPESVPERPSQPLLDTASAIKKLPARRQHSIFTPIDEERSILSQHLASFAAEPRAIKEEEVSGRRSQSAENGAMSHSNGSPSPPMPQRSNTSNIAKSRNSASSIPKPTFTPPSRSNSLRMSGPRPKLKVQIPDEQSDSGSTAADSTTSPRNASAETTAQTARKNGTEPHSSGVVLPPPSPSASALLSAGATGPPNPFARPMPQSQGNSMNIDTPVSALPSRFVNHEFLPSPSTFYPEWNFGRNNDSNTLPSPLNFATPIVGTGPSFLRDDNPNKRKSPEISTAGHIEGPEGGEAKRIKVDS